MATAMDVMANPSAPTLIGRVGENEFRRIKFPISTWLELYPSATFSLVHRRANDGGGYPIADDDIDTDSSYLYWTIKSGDLAQAGIGHAELIIKSGDTIAKSVVYQTQILNSVVETEDAPTPWESYIDRVYDSAANIDANIEAAEQAAGDAEAALEALQGMSVAATTLAAGSSATATKTVDSETGVAMITFGIPAGADGVAPKIQNGTWWVWDALTSAYVDTTIPASGTEVVRLI